MLMYVIKHMFDFEVSLVKTVQQWDVCTDKIWKYWGTNAVNILIG